MSNECYICKSIMADNEGEEFIPYQLPELGDYPVMVCGTCEQSKEHQDNVETTDVNHRAEDSYQEYMASLHEEEGE